MKSRKYNITMYKDTNNINKINNNKNKLSMKLTLHTDTHTKKLRWTHPDQDGGQVLCLRRVAALLDEEPEQVAYSPHPSHTDGNLQHGTQ